MKTNRLCMLFPYFGIKPAWFDFFILSCNMNPDIDWLFFTDCLNSKYKRENVEFYKMTLNEFNKLATEKLG